MESEAPPPLQVEALLMEPTDPDAASDEDDGSTALIEASENGHPEVIHLLLEATSCLRNPFRKEEAFFLVRVRQGLIVAGGYELLQKPPPPPPKKKKNIYIYIYILPCKGNPGIIVYIHTYIYIYIYICFLKKISLLFFFGVFFFGGGVLKQIVEGRCSRRLGHPQRHHSSGAGRSKRPP